MYRQQGQHETNHLQAAVCRLYRSGLRLYPKDFREQFAVEMTDVFSQALDVHIRLGTFTAFCFLAREFIDTPLCALRRFFLSRAGAIKTYLIVIFLYSVSFTLLGLFNLIQASHSLTSVQVQIVIRLGHAVICGLGGLTVGILLHPRRQITFAALGMCFSLVHFLFPSLAIELLICGAGVIVMKKAYFLRLAGYGTLILFVGWFVNRLAAALVQSYVFHSPTQLLSQTGPAMVWLPFAVTGVMLGVLMGRIGVKARPVNA